MLVSHVSLLLDYPFRISTFICIPEQFLDFYINIPLTLAIWNLKLEDWETSTSTSSPQTGPPLGTVPPPPGQTFTQLGLVGLRQIQARATARPGCQDHSHKPRPGPVSLAKWAKAKSIQSQDLLLLWFASTITIQRQDAHPSINHPSFSLSIHLSIHMSIHPSFWLAFLWRKGKEWVPLLWPWCSGLK